MKTKKPVVNIVSDEIEISDGYHTFSELYNHRFNLYIALCSVVFWYTLDHSVWRSKVHSDGTSYDGWFVLGMNTEKGEQITYHLPLSKWKETNFAVTLDKSPNYDGHSPNDVMKRLKKQFIEHKTI